MAADWLAERLGQPQIRRALMVAVPLVWTIASVARRRRQTGSGSGSALVAPFWRCATSTTAKPAASASIRASSGGADGLRGVSPSWIPLYDAGDAAKPIAPNAYDYVISFQPRSKELGIRRTCRLTLRASATSKSNAGWAPTIERMTLDRICHWQRPGPAIPDQRSCSPRKSEKRLRPSSTDRRIRATPFARASATRRPLCSDDGTAQAPKSRVKRGR